MTGAAPDRRGAWCAWISGAVEEDGVILVRAETEEEALRAARGPLNATDADVVDVARCPDGWETWLPDEYELEEGSDSDFSVVVTGVPGFTERSRVALAEVRFASSFPELHFLARRIARLVGAAPALYTACEKARSELEALVAAQENCGDRDAECPLHDAHKAWHGVQDAIAQTRGALALARGGAA